MSKDINCCNYHNNALYLTIPTLRQSPRITNALSKQPHFRPSTPIRRAIVATMIAVEPPSPQLQTTIICVWSGMRMISIVRSRYGTINHDQASGWPRAHRRTEPPPPIQPIRYSPVHCRWWKRSTIIWWSHSVRRSARRANCLAYCWRVGRTHWRRRKSLACGACCRDAVWVRHRCAKCARVEQQRSDRPDGLAFVQRSWWQR